MNPSDDLQLLASNELGHILFLAETNQMMIGLGTVILKFPPQGCKVFLKTVSGLQCKLKCSSGCRSKAFIQTPINNMMIALNQKEVSQAVELLEMALLRLEVEELLKY